MRSTETTSSPGHDSRISRATTVAKTILRLLSAGSVEPGLVRAVEAFGAQHDCEVRIEWATTPNIRRRLRAGEVFDLVVLTADAGRDLAACGRLRPSPQVAIGSVGVAFAVRAGAASPDIESVDQLFRALRAADSIVFTLATSGLAVESMLRREGIYDELLAKIRRFETGPQMMDHLIHSTGDVACLGAAVELRMFDGHGVRHVGPIPEPLQTRTPYVAALANAVACPDEAIALAYHLASGEGRRHLAECGVDVPAA